jgi:CHAD domain-containing protein
VTGERQYANLTLAWRGRAPRITHALNFMAFCFKRRESVPKGIRRLGRERIDNVLKCLKKPRRSEAIHGARKDIKKVRAVLRLVRTKIRQKDYHRLITLLREAANQLAPPRDAYIRTKTLRALSRHYEGQIKPGALRHIQLELRLNYDDEMKRFANEKAAKSVERARRHVAKEWDRLKIGGKGWKALRPGVNAAYTRGQEVFQLVLEDPSPANFHLWRKRAKDLWYQLTLLRRLWPEQMEPMAHELETLGEYLGDDHDLDMLRLNVEDKCADANSREGETLKALIDERQRELRTAALALGSRFYAEKSSAFCDRIAGYWRVWRREKKPGTGAVKTAF